MKCPTLTTFIIKFLNRFGVTTISSGIDESVMVAFTGDDPTVMCNVLFKDLRKMTSHLSGVLFELTHTRISGYMGVIECRPEDLGDISNRLGVWLEMIRK